MQPMYYIGLDVHKRKISYCVKDSSGKIHIEGSIYARGFVERRILRFASERRFEPFEAVGGT
jgi:hypothetical protein